MRDVRLWLDLISPYSYLALTQARRFEEENRVRFDVRPIVYAKVLDATGLVGPVEVEAKRSYTFADVLRTAHRLGVPLVGPPAHPFRSLEALRTIGLHLSDGRALDLAVALSSACWGEGRDLTDVAVLSDIVGRVGLDASGLAERIAAPEAKERLATSTAEAIASGVFGVPTFAVDGEMFWGQDRMPHLADYLAGRLPPARELGAGLASRPAGAARPRRPGVKSESRG